jgi:hypothetical protein
MCLNRVEIKEMKSQGLQAANASGQGYRLQHHLPDHKTRD